MTATITIEFHSGFLEEAFEEAARLVKMLGVGVRFKFNGDSCYVARSGTVGSQGVKLWEPGPFGKWVRVEAARDLSKAVL